MKRLLYMFLAAAVSTGAVPFEADADELEARDDAVEVIDGTDAERRLGRGVEAGAAVIVRLLPPGDEPGAGDAGAECVIVDRSVPYVAAVRSHESGCDGSGLPRLLAAALRDAWDHGDLKVQIDSALPLAELRRVCGANRFMFSRTVTRHGRPVHEFLADLYRAHGFETS